MDNSRYIVDLLFDACIRQQDRVRAAAHFEDVGLEVVTV